MGSKGLHELHVAVIFDRVEEILKLLKERTSWTFDYSSNKGQLQDMWRPRFFSGRSPDAAKKGGERESTRQ